MNEISLKKLLLLFWNEKLIFVFLVIMSLILTSSFVNYREVRWTSQSIITEPRDSELFNIRREYSSLYSLGGEVKMIDSILDKDKLYNNFKTNLNSPAVKKDYFEQSNANGLADVIALSEMIKMKDGDKKAKSSIMTNTSHNKDNSQRQLIGYINFVNDVTQKEIDNDLKSYVLSLKSKYEEELKLLEDGARQKKNNLIEINKNAISISKFSTSSNVLFVDDDIFPINIGSDALIEKGRILDEMKNLSIIEPSINNIKYKIKLISDVEYNKIHDFKLYTFLKEPSLPLNYDDASKKMFFILGFFITLVVFSLYTLTKYLWVSKRGLNDDL